MVQSVDAENVSHDLSPFSITDDNNTISCQVHEYFSVVEAGRIPVIPISNQPFISSMRNANGETLLIVAARSGHVRTVESLTNDIDIEETDNDGWNALLNAAHHGHAEAARVLLEAGCSVDQPDLMGWTPLMWACYKNRVEVVNVLLTHKAHINVVGEEDSLTPLIIASGRGYIEVVQRLLKSGAQVNSSDKFGSTALIWAARRGHVEIVEELLTAASTALMLATRGNHIKVVSLLIAHDPNVNIVDYNGLSALGIAAREGYTEIAQTLIQSGAYVNTVDRFGNSILASAVRSGNIHLVRMLLEKHADVNAKDTENRTPLHLAIDKGYIEIVLALLEKKPNLELRNKDGETALLRAVKNRDVALCQLLVNMGAKLSATDNSGDNALHLALRARSKRLTQTLLVNPSDSKLLYRPNKLGETPYSIDESTGQPILPSIFGPIGSTDLDLKNFLGYDAYGDVLADVVCEPHLTLPLTIGLYAKWGSGKSLLLPKIRCSMESFSRSWLDGMELYWSWTLIILLLFLCAFPTLVFYGIACLISSEPVGWTAPVVFGVSLYVSLISAYGFVYYGSEIRLWNGSISTARFIARAIARFKVLLSVLTLSAPMRTDKELVVSPVSFLFADDHRLSFIGGEQALTNIVQSLFLSAEKHYGALAVRLFTAFHNINLQQSNSRLQTLCGIPVIMYIIVMIVSLIVSICLYIKHSHLNEMNDTMSYAITALVFLCIFGISALAPAYLICIRLSLNLPKRRISRISHKIHLMPFERAVQKLQREVDLLVALINTLDAFTNSQTRMVIMIDGLDSCEQNKMVQILDALMLFFGSRQQAPFIIILAVDPYIIISAIQQNLQRGVSSTATAATAVSATGVPISEITGRDYMRNVVSMPFYLDHTELKQLQINVGARRRFRTGSMKDYKRSDTTAPFRSSRLSLRTENQKDIAATSALIGNSTTAIGNTGGGGELGNMLPSFDYFSNMNPRTMQRIVNSMALTGRLMRTFEIEFSWFMLYTWVSLIEQWPYRMCWIIECCCPDETFDLTGELHLEDSTTLAEVYQRIKRSINQDNSLATELDRNVAEFNRLILHKKRRGNEFVFGASAKLQQSHEQQLSQSEKLTVFHARLFSSCTSNLDPYLRKQVRKLCSTSFQVNQSLINLDKDNSADEESYQKVASNVPATSEAEFLFGDESPLIWSDITKPLIRMSIEEIVQLVVKLKLSCVERQQAIVEQFHINNLNGLVLQTCGLDELKEILGASLGDWTLIRLLVETLRKWKPQKISSEDTKVTVDKPKLSTSDCPPTEDVAIVSDDSSLLSIARAEQNPRFNLQEPSNSTGSDSEPDSMKSIVGSRQNLVS